MGKFIGSIIAVAGLAALTVVTLGIAPALLAITQASGLLTPSLPKPDTAATPWKPLRFGGKKGMQDI